MFLVAISVFLFHIIFIFYFLDGKTETKEEKRDKETNKQRNLHHELNFLYVNIFGPINFSARLINNKGVNRYSLRYVIA